jgi:phospholipid/cholesterol/gamma-HCH transport system ATP-binding protein
MKDFKIEMQGVKKSFGSKDVLRNIDLNVKKGESLVIIGGSGTGKSVTIKTILGLIKPDAGKILVDGQDVTNLGGNDRDEYLKKFGMLFQGGALFDSMTIWENVAFGLTQGQKMSKKEAYPIAIEKLEAVGLKESIAQHYPAELSGGMQKRVSLARAIARNPEIIFFDEPTTGLDPIMADVINDLIRKCVSELGATAVSITHDMASVRKIADSVAMIYGGEIIWHGPIDKLDNSGNEYVDQFINGRADGPVKF